MVAISSSAAGEEQMVMAKQPIMISVGAVIEDEAYFLIVKPLPSLYGIISYQKGGGEHLMNRTRGFVNLNRFKSGRTIKRLKRVVDKYKFKRQSL